MADIYKARRHDASESSPTIVVKKILPQYSGLPAFTGMLEQEAQVCKTLSHRKVVGFLDSGQVAGEHYIAMEHVEGKDLLRVLARCAKKKARIPLDLAAFIVAEVADALHYAHTLKDDQGRGLQIVHRDVSPSNVLVSFNGDVKVTDFGVAKADFHPEKELGEGMLKGKVGYMSPEQVSGRPFNFKADVFSLGILLYETVTLKRAFMGRTDLETLLNIRACKIENKLKKHPYLPIPILEVLRHTLTPSLDQRYASAGACGEALRGYINSVGGFADKTALMWFMADLFNPEASILPGAPCILSNTKYAETPGAEIPSRAEVRAPASQVLSSPTGFAGEPVGFVGKAPPPAEKVVHENEQLPPLAETPQAAESEDPSALTEAVVEDRPDTSKSSEPSESSEQRVRLGRPQTQPPVRAETIFGSGRSADSDQSDGSRARHSLRAVPASLLSGLTEPVGKVVDVDPEQLRGSSFRLQKGEGHEFGPISFWNLARMIVRGGVAPNERVSIEGDNWIPVQNVRGLQVLFRKNLEIKQQLPAYDGPVSVLSFPNTLYRLAGERSSGFLRVQAGMDIRDVYFRNGRIVDVHSTSRTELFGQTLVRDGVVVESDLKEALDAISFGSRRLGEALAGNGRVSVLVIPQLIEQNAKERLRQAFCAEGAWYAFFQGAEFSVDSDLSPIAAAPFTTLVLRDLLDPEFLQQIFAKHGSARIRLRDKPYLDPGALGCTPKEFRFLNMLLRTRKIDDALKSVPGDTELHTTIYRVALILLLAGLIEFPDGNPIAEHR